MSNVGHPKNTQKALFGALRGRCPKLLKKHSVGHFQARAPEQSCKWRPGSQKKNQPKEEVFGTDIPRTSGGHSRGYPGQKLRSGRSKPWKNKHLGADIHDPKARTSTTLAYFQKLRSEKLWAELSFPIFGPEFKNVLVDAPVLGERLPEVTQNPMLGRGRLSLQCIERTRKCLQGEHVFREKLKGNN